MINPSKSSANHRIDPIDITTDLLADRGGLAPLMRYVHRTGVLPAIASPFEKYRDGGKGIAPSKLIGQVMAFFFDGTSRHLTYFDHLKTDLGYAALLETSTDGLVSSHQVKRFFSKLPKVVASPFRCLLRNQFAARLEKKDLPASSCSSIPWFSTMTTPTNAKALSRPTRGSRDSNRCS